MCVCVCVYSGWMKAWNTKLFWLISSSLAACRLFAFAWLENPFGDFLIDWSTKQKKIKLKQVLWQKRFLSHFFLSSAKKQNFPRRFHGCQFYVCLCVCTRASTRARTSWINNQIFTKALRQIRPRCWAHFSNNFTSFDARLGAHCCRWRTQSQEKA